MRVTLRDVAQRSGYAVSTVSHVLNNRPTCFVSEEAKRRIFDAASSLGYRPNFYARALRNNHSSPVGIACALFENPARMVILQSLRAKLAQQNFVSFFADIGHDPQQYLKAVEDMAGLSPEGILLLSDMPCPEPVNNVSLATPLVLISPFPLRGVATLLLDQKSAFKALAEKLAAMGHRRILFCSSDTSSDAAKIAGFRSALSERRLEGEVMAIPSSHDAITAFVQKHFAAFDRFTAILTGQDAHAAAIINSLQKAGKRIPHDCSVAGFGDTEISRLTTPQITTIRPSREEAGAMAVEMLVERMSGRSAEGRVLVPELVERGSTGALERTHVTLT